jgi:hypothetical protein
MQSTLRYFFQVFPDLKYGLFATECTIGRLQCLKLRLLLAGKITPEHTESFSRFGGVNTSGVFI